MKTADDILREARSRDELDYVYKKIQQNRLAAQSVPRDSKFCPKCRQPIDKVVSPTPDGRGKTIYMCHICGWNREFPYGMDEGRQIHEQRRLGKRAPSTATRVIMSPDGKIRRIQ